MTADDYIDMFLRHIPQIMEEAERVNFPWEWCIDDLPEDGEYFCPIWVILGDSRIYTLFYHELKTITLRKETELGENVGEKTRLNNRYRRENTFYKKRTSINIESFVCNYFRKRPIVKEGTRLEAGHLFSYDSTKDSIYNNNMLNVKWQTQNDNLSVQKLLTNGKYEAVFERESERIGAPIELEDIEARNRPISPDGKGLKEALKMIKPDEKVKEELEKRLGGLPETAVEFHRDEAGTLSSFTIRNSRHIELINE